MKLVLAIDGSNWVHRAWHTPGASKNHATSVFCQMLEKADRTIGPTHLVVAFDHPSPTWRHALFPGYKAGRDPEPPELTAQLELSAKAAEAYGCQVFRVPGVEGDDVLATIATRATVAGVPVIIGSSDKDMAQLASDGVKLLDPKYNVLGPSEVESKWGVPPSKLRDVLALMGDSTDGIPGIDGIGPATAASLVAQYGSALEAVAHADEVGGKRGASLAAGRETVELCLCLATLKTNVDLGAMLTATRRTPEAFSEFRKKIEEEVVSHTVACYGVCKGDPNWRSPEGYACSMCSGKGTVTSYNDRLLQAKEWDAATHRDGGES